MRLPLLLLALLTTSAQAQRRPPVLYFQIGGEGLGLSANLDVGVTQSLRLRGGAGYVWVAGTVPFSATYLLTRKNSTFEIGGGATVLIFPADRNKNDNSLTHWLERVIFLEGQGTKVAGVGILGYRYHPAEGALLRLTFTPLVLQGHVHAYGGLSFGFTF
jgi:hypothetical protein